MSHYILEFSDIKGGAKTNKDFTISSSSEADPAKHLNVPNTEEKGLKDIIFQLKELKYVKGLYAPCSVEAVVNVSNFNDAANVNLLTGLFHERTVTLKCDHGITGYADAPAVVGRDYFVYEARPSVKFGAGGVSGCTISLKIFSRDYLLTIQKYSRAYTSRKFGADIIKATLASSSGAQGAPKNGEHILSSCLVDVNVDVNRLQCTKVDGKELIQPYHVQYNEDFYSFIRRIAARHGEFLFFEDGKLTLGIKPSAGPTSLDAVNITGQTKPVNVVLSMEQTDTVTSVPEVNPLYSNYLFRNGVETQKSGPAVYEKRYEARNKAAGEPKTATGANLYYNEDCYDEYFDICDTSDESLPDTFANEQTWGFYIIAFLTQFLPMCSSWAHDGSFFGTEKFSELAVAVGMQEAKLAKIVKQVNDYYKERVNISLPYSTEQVSSYLTSQFASFTDAGNKSNFMNAFYWLVREKEREASGSIVTMKVRPGMKKLNVGDVVELSKTKYMVTRVSGNFSISNTPVDTCSIEALRIVKDAVVYPPYDKCSEHAVAGPQVAIVMTSSDPRYLNRVRVKYPWQTAEEPASPWVRLSTPYATGGGAVSFRMNKGDEVMLDYIDGNIDRPYVVGALMNANIFPDKMQYKPGDCEIRSDSGARLRLDSSNAFNFIADFIPAWGTVAPFLGPTFGTMMYKMKNGEGPGGWQKIFGMDIPWKTISSMASKATLTDSFGFFEISGDSAKRAVTIDSSIGKVTVSALTGIKVSAPLGDVVIEGKNISLKAGNNITIESGLNIKDELDLKEAKKRVDRIQEGHGAIASGLLTVGNHLAKNVSALLLNSVDMSLFRLIYDVVNTPKEGSMKVKSYRYVAIEAGEGDAKDVPGCYYPKGSYSYDILDKVHNLAVQLAVTSLKKRLDPLVFSCDAYTHIIQQYIHYNVADGSHLGGNDNVEQNTIISSKRILDILLPQDNQEVPENKRWIQGGAFQTPAYATSKKVVLNSSNLLMKYAKAFKEYVNDPIKKSKSSKKLSEELPSSIKDIVIDAFKEIMASYKHGDKITGLTAAAMDEVYGSLASGTFRLAVARCVGVEGSGIIWKNGAVGLVQSADGLLTPECWTQLTDGVKIDDNAGKPEVTTGAKAALLDHFYNPFTKNYKTPAGLWREGQSGKVLISAAKGKTFMVDNSSNEWISKEDVAASNESLTEYLRTR